jgi:L-fuconolactonase
MSDRADAHIHLFENGFQGSFTARPGVRIDEGALYTSLAADYRVKQALVVGYEGEAWARGNNAHIAAMTRQHAWVRPLAFVHLETPPDLDGLNVLWKQGFVGISLYVFSRHEVHALQQISDDVWVWIARHHWLVSVNTRGRGLNGWRPILDRHPELRLLISHMGLPPQVSQAPSADMARTALAELIEIARFRETRVKLSGFYAISEPGYAYPHCAAWSYVGALAEVFGPKRLLWGSDFAPALDSLSFGQTIGLFAEMPFLTDEDRQAIEGGNLLSLLGEIQTGTVTRD